MDLGTCQCCEKEPAITVACSSMGAFSIAWCRSCLTHGAEPYWACVATASCCGWPEGLADWAKETIMVSLSLLGKTVEQFTADVEAALAEERAGLAEAEKGCKAGK